jgi:hypothetical protein
VASCGSTRGVAAPSTRRTTVTDDATYVVAYVYAGRPSTEAEQRRVALVMEAAMRDLLPPRTE